MNKYKETFGVDISKDVFDVHGSATGYYHYRLAQFLYKNEVYYGTGNRKLKLREMTKNRTLNARKKQYQKINLN